MLTFTELSYEDCNLTALTWFLLVTASTTKLRLCMCSPEILFWGGICGYRTPSLLQGFLGGAFEKITCIVLLIFDV
jgi:hypothetical protein